MRGVVWMDVVVRVSRLSINNNKIRREYCIVEWFSFRMAYFCDERFELANAGFRARRKYYDTVCNDTM